MRPCLFSYTELDHLGAAERVALDIADSVEGSVQIVCVSGLKESFEEVVGRHDAILATGRGGQAQVLADVFFSDHRTRSTSPAHQQRIRRQRRREVAGQLVDRVRGR